MCGIYGMVSLDGHPLRHPELLSGMRQDLRHRGPDGHGCQALAHAAMGVNRLRIVDRTAAADQPFTDPTGAAWLALNGEIYNAAALRSRYSAFPYRSRSDAEPVLAAYLARGRPAIEELDGMFALAIWDERTRTLTLARDRAGEKPLFYSIEENEVWFASEIQPLLRRPRARVLDRSAFREAVRLGYILEPRTPFHGINRIPSGSAVTFPCRPGAGAAPAGETFQYWDVAAIRPRPASDSPGALAGVLGAAVHRQLAADVPVGVFTSGGLDSSLLVALAAPHVRGPIHTFTARFPERSYDESGFARSVARRFRTRHIEVPADDSSLCRALESVTSRIAEPVADPAVLPVALLAAEARRHVGVVLSGEGADELFGGYPTCLGHRLAPWWLRVPRGLRQAFAVALDAIPESTGKVPVDFLLRRFVAAAELPWQERHTSWFGTGLPEDVLAPGAHPVAASDGGRGGPRRDSIDEVLQAAMTLDYSTYLRDNLLVKVDRATMLHSLEARAPYLDRAVTELAFSLPPGERARFGSPKHVLRQVARRHLPAAILRRRKRGLSLPVGRLLNGPLAAEADRLFAAGRLSRQGLLNPAAITQLLAQHRRGRFAVSRGLWTLFIWQRWLDHWIPEASE